MNVGAFAVDQPLGASGETLRQRSKTTLGWDAALLCWPPILTIFLLSLIGIPVTGGFFAKFYVFSAAHAVEPGLD